MVIANQGLRWKVDNIVAQSSINFIEFSISEAASLHFNKELTRSRRL